MVGAESREVMWNQIMKVLFTDTQGGIEKGGGVCFIHTKFELPDKYPRGTVRSELGIRV